MVFWLIVVAANLVVGAFVGLTGVAGFLLPIDKATNDSGLLDVDWYVGKWKKLTERLRTIVRKKQNT